MQLILLFLLICEMILVVSIFLHMPLSWVALTLILILFIIIFNKVKSLKINKNSINISKYKYKSKILIIIFSLIIYQMYIVTTNQHIDDDDAWYLGFAVASYETGTLFEYSPNTGESIELSDMKDYVLSPLPIFWAVFSYISHVHPLIIAHTIMPAIILLWAYWIYWKLGFRIFKNTKSAYYFLLFINILNLFSFYTTRTMGTFLLLRPWQGKAIFYCIMVPLLFYYFLGLLEEEKVTWKSKNLLGIYLTMGAATLVSFSAVTLMPLLLGAFAITYAFYKHNIRIPLRMCMGMSLNVVLIIIYIFIL